jgi:hypothetical protein
MALSAGKQVRSLVDGKTDFAPQKGSSTIYAGGIVMLDSSGRALKGATATGCIGVGLALTNRDLDTYDNSSGADGALSVRFDEGIFLAKNSSAGDAIAAGDEGKPCYIVDDETVAKTDGSSTRSPAGRVFRVDSAGVWVQMSKAIGRQVAEEKAQVSGITFTQTYSTATATVPAPTAAALTDNSGGATADGTIGAVTAPAAITDSSGGVDPGNNTIAVVTNPDLSAWNGSTDPSAAQATAIGGAFTSAKAAIAQLAAKQNVDRTAIIALTDAVKELSTVVNELVADSAANRQLINKLIDALQAAGIAA